MDEHTIDDDVDARGEVDDGEQMALVSPGTTLPVPNGVTNGNANGGVSKRYRPAPAKTFQCRGYGECRMVFSRSEHLARHVRKHTGERPFTCHCSKQFSRLDNLRQHAQTVHADRAEANERMMRELGVLHAGMVAAGGGTPATSTSTSTTTTTKKAANRRSRAVAPAPPAPVPAAAASAALTSPTQKAPSPRSPNVKSEPTEPVLGGATMTKQRPGTSTGYEGGMEVHREEEESHTQSTTHRNAPSPPHAAPGRAHSFRGDASANDQRSFLGSAGGGADRGGAGQSFRGHPYARRSPPEHTPSPPTHTLNGLPAPRTALHSSGGRPYSSGTGPFQPSPTGSSFPALSGSRPSTGSGTRLPPLSAVVPAAAFRPTSGHGLATGGSILLPNSLTLRRPSTSDWEWDSWTGGARPGTAPGKLATAVAAATTGDDSPFSFHVPDQTAAFSIGQSSRKRTLGGPDGPYGSYPDEGSQSRPTSRRLSLMELCHDDDAVERRPGSSSFALLSSEPGERPTTTNGLVARASALVLDDQREREFESREYAGEQSFAASPFAFGVATSSRSRSDSVHGGDAVASGGTTSAFARGGSSGGVSAAAGGGGAAVSAGAGAAARRGAVPSAATSDSVAVAGTSGGGVLRAVPDGDVRPAAAAEGGYGYSYAAVGRVSASTSGSVSPPGRFSFGPGPGLSSHVSAAAAAPSIHQPQRPGGGASGSVFARGVPASSSGVPIRADDAFLGVQQQRRRDGDDLRYGHGHGVGGIVERGYEYEQQHDRIGGARGGGMRV
ncbi:hypothetical protein FB45DRAFT_921078 [Roridomyces roridus]|uniref:C2H2-type domain-containing protein n=1 Tax=Roridomyces roridus TaxID=1738132 RepID=A0AAD7FLU6_9AGAR|nr:hypothetical protein FB45DRAFT_921078 [Roridomyces roridus]